MNLKVVPTMVLNVLKLTHLLENVQTWILHYEFILLFCIGLEMQILQIFKEKRSCPNDYCCHSYGRFRYCYVSLTSKYKTKLTFCILIIPVYSKVMKFE